MDSTAFIEQNFEELNDREIARELDILESEVERIREDNGFLRLEGFKESEKPKDTIQVNFDLDEMRKRQLQGFVGEKICSLMENRVVNFLDEHVKVDWVLRDKAQLLNTENQAHRYHVGGRPEKGDIEIEGDTVKHFDVEKNEIIDEIEERCVAAEESLFEKFREVRNPWIDFSFYAFSVSGKEKRKFQCRDYSKPHMERKDSVEAEIPFVEDFKIIALEVKTTKDEEENLLSENQRKIREIAQNSPFIEFFTLKVETEFGDLDIPESFNGIIQKHS